ncbi:MAG: HTH domain-containing protein, partial [Candidatus Micrarchaeota archaeon]
MDAIAKAIKEGRHVEYEGKTIVFPNLDLLRQFLTPQRLRMLHAIRTQNPSSVYELAKMLKRDRRNVLKDLRSLQDLGLIKIRKENKKAAPRRNLVPQVDFSRIVVGIPI